jgi:enoyl-CoA hydratase
MSVLLVEKSGGIATITLNRPEALNALNAELRLAIETTFRDLAKDDEVRVAILTGAGRAFSAGIDLKELSRGRMESSGAADYDMIGAIRDFGAPLIGAVNGHAITGGFELALACDLLIASENAQFGDTHARVGIVPGWALSQKLPRLIGIARAKELSLTGNFIGAEQAERWGTREPRRACVRAPAGLPAARAGHALVRSALTAPLQADDRCWLCRHAQRWAGARAADVPRSPHRRHARGDRAAPRRDPGPRSPAAEVMQVSRSEAKPSEVHQAGGR